jgi:hypothetical protein
MQADAGRRDFSMACVRPPKDEAANQLILTSLSESGWTEYRGSLHYPTYYRLDACSDLMLFPLSKADLCSQGAPIDYESLPDDQWLIAFIVDPLDPCVRPKELPPLDIQPSGASP